MIRRVIIRPKAVEEITEAATWYDNQALGLGEQLADEIISAIRRAQDNPGLFRILNENGIRRVLIDRFPYRVFFSVVDDVLYVHAVLHGARHDSRWKSGWQPK